MNNSIIISFLLDSTLTLIIFLFIVHFLAQYFQDDGGHLINVMKNGKSSISQFHPARLFFPEPEINQISGGSTTTKGGQTLQVTGSFFGPISSNIVVTFGDFSCTNVVWKSDSLLELVTPAMTGSGESKNMVVEVTAGNQSNKASFAFAYTTPTITKIDLIAQKVPIGAVGVRMVVHGTEFADVIPNRIIIRGIKGATTVDCLNITRVSYEELQCDYPQGGDGATGFNAEVEIAGQTANDVQLVYCSDVRIDTKLNGVADTAIAVERGQPVSFTAQLSTPLAAISGAVTVRAAIVSGGEQNCMLTAPTGDIQRSHNNYDAPFFVNMTTTESEERLIQRCVIKLTLESEDPCYKDSVEAFKHELEITVTPKICL